MASIRSATRSLASFIILCARPSRSFFGENGRVSGLDVGVFLELLGVRDDLHLGQFVTAEGAAAYHWPARMAASVRCLP